MTFRIIILHKSVEPRRINSQEQSLTSSETCPSPHDFFVVIKLTQYSASSLPAYDLSIVFAKFIILRDSPGAGGGGEGSGWGSEVGLNECNVRSEVLFQKGKSLSTK